jgi:ribosomal protein S18 acetylase RimI-like enzyme
MMNSRGRDDMLTDVSPDFALLDRLDRYYDAVPRGRSNTEEVGPFTLFVAVSGWPYYARPSRSSPPEASTDDVRRVLARQSELKVPQAIEWVHELAPSLVAHVEEAGASVLRAPLLVLRGEPRGETGAARMLGSEDKDAIAASRAAVSVAFDVGGTGSGREGLAARETALASEYAQVQESVISRMESGEIRMAAAFDPDEPEVGPVGGGSYSPVGDVAEIAGVGVLPAYRRQGLAAQLTYVLARDALGRGVTTVFCSAQSEDVARVYGRIGFERVGTACIAEFAAAVG